MKPLASTQIFDPTLDLILERVVDVPRELVWAAWTQPQYVKQWFTPAPWQTIDCEIDLRPGGIFRTQFRGPEGQEFPNVGCYLEIIPNEKLVFTDVLQPGFRPTPDTPGTRFTAIILLQPHGSHSTKYTAHAMHRDAAGRKAHKEMGFHQGWGKALEQLVAVAKAM